jgi:hypothetical protein
MLCPILNWTRCNKITSEIYGILRDQNDEIIDIIKNSTSTNINIPTHISIDHYFALTIADRRNIEKLLTKELGFTINLCVISRHVFIQIIL